MRKIIARVLSFTAISFFWSGFVLAASEPGGALNNIFASEIQANYTDADGTVQGSTEIINASSSQTFENLEYKLYLLAEADYQSFRFSDETEFLGSFTIKPGEKLKKTFDYQVPLAMPAGDYILRFQIIDNAGRRVAYNDYSFTKKTSASDVQLMVKQENVKLIVNGTEEHEWNEGPSLKPEDKVEIKFLLENKSSSQMPNLPASIKIHEYNSNGKLVEEKSLGNINIGAGENKEVRYEMPKYVNPSSYFASIEINKSGIFAPPVQARWVIEGSQGKLLSVGQQDGKLSIELVGSPFVNGKEGLIKLIYESKEGKVCGTEEKKVKDINENVATIATNPIGNADCIPATIEAKFIVDGKEIDSQSFAIGSIDSLVLSNENAAGISLKKINPKPFIVLVILLFAVIPGVIFMYVRKVRKNRNLYMSLFIIMIFVFPAALLFINNKSGENSDNIIGLNKTQVLGEQASSVGSYGKFGPYAITRQSNDHYYSEACSAINTYIQSSSDDNTEQVYNVDPYVKSCTCKNTGETHVFEGDGRPAEAALDYCYYDVCKYQSRPSTKHGPLSRVWFEGVYTAGYGFNFDCDCNNSQCWPVAGPSECSGGGNIRQYVSNESGAQWYCCRWPETCNFSCLANLDKCVCNENETKAVSDSPFGPFNYNVDERKIDDPSYDEQEIRDYCTFSCNEDLVDLNYCQASECECTDGYKFPVNGTYTATCRDGEVTGNTQSAWEHCQDRNVCLTSNWSPIRYPENYFSDIDYVAHSTNDDIDQQRQCLLNNEPFCYLAKMTGCDGNPHRTYHHSQINWASPVPNARYTVNENVIARVMNADFWCDNSSRWGSQVRFKVYNDDTGELVLNVTDEGAWDQHPVNYSADLGTFVAGKYTIYMEARAESQRLYQGMIRNFTVVDPNAESVTVNLKDTSGTPINYTGSANFLVGGSDAYTLNYNNSSSETLVKDMVCPGGTTPCVGQPGVEVTAPVIANYSAGTVDYSQCAYNPALGTGTLSDKGTCVVDITYDPTAQTVQLLGSTTATAHPSDTSWSPGPVLIEQNKKEVDLKAVPSGFNPASPIQYDFYCNVEDSVPAASGTNDFRLNLCSYSSVGQKKAKVIATQGALSAEGRLQINVTATPTCSAKCGSANRNVYENETAWPSGATACASGSEGSLPIFKTCALGGGVMTWKCSTSPTCSINCFARNDCDPAESSNPRGTIEVSP